MAVNTSLLLCFDRKCTFTEGTRQGYRLHSYVQRDGTVVASLHLVTDLAVTKAGQQAAGQHKVVEPPAHVFVASIHHIGPEGVGVGLLGVQLAEAVHEPGLQQLAEALALLGREACVLLVSFGILQIDLLVGNVQVTAQHHRLLDVQHAEIRSEVGVPCFAVIQTHKASARIRHVGGHQEEAGKLCCDGAALLVVLLFAWRRGGRVGQSNSAKKTDFKWSLSYILPPMVDSARGKFTLIYFQAPLTNAISDFDGFRLAEHGHATVTLLVV